MVELKEKEIEIEGEKFKIRELNAEDGLSFARYKKDNMDKLAKEIIRKSVIEPKEIDLKALPFRFANKLMEEITTLSGIKREDFPAVPESSQQPTSGD